MYIGFSKSIGALRLHCGGKFGWVWFCIGAMCLATWYLFKLCFMLMALPFKLVYNAIKNKQNKQNVNKPLHLEE